jgi:hypothetical protein
MTYINNICNSFNFTYLDFLETNLFKTKVQIAEDSKRGGVEVLQAIAETEKENERSDTDFFNSAIDNSFDFPSIDFKNSFYLGHFEFKSLLSTSQGQNIIYSILNHRANKMARIKTLFEELKADIKKDDINYNIEDFEKSFIEIFNKKNIDTYSQFLHFYNNKFNKENLKYVQFYNTFKADKESYINFILATNKPTQTFFKKKLETYIPNKARYKHTYIISGTGTGKSELIKGLIYSVLRTQTNKKKEKRENFILIEPHSDLSTQVFNLCTNFKTDTVLLDPFLNNDLTPVLNPFEFEGTEAEREQYTEELLAVFKEILGAEFTQNGEALLMPCLATLLKIPNTSLYDLQTFMNDEENEELVNRGKITKNFAHKNFFETNFYSTNLNSTKRAVFLKLQTLLNNKTFSNLTTGKTTLDIEKIMNNGTNLIIKLNKQKMRGTLEPFGRFIISKIQSIALKRSSIQESKRPKTHLFIDEFQNFVTPTIEEILTESRKYKLFLTMAHQVLKQIEESKLKDIILSNTNIKIVGRNGTETINKLSKELNVKTEEFQNLGVGQFFGKIGDKPAFKFKYKLVDPYFFKFSDLTKKALKDQEEKYYIKPTARKVIIKTDKKKDFVNSVIKDKKDHIEPQTDQKQEEPIKRARKPKINKF